MASLAANIPAGSDPEYLRYSHPISSIEGSKAGYYLSKGLGDAVEEGITSADKLVGKIAEKTAYEEGQQANKEMEAAIDPLYRQIVKGENPNESSVNTPLQFAENKPSLLQGNRDVPPEVVNGTRQAASLNERFKNGKITQTDYDANIDTLAKDLNSRFPAWRSEIGRGLQKATGRDNANLSIADKIRDINTIMNQLGDQKNKVTSEIMSSKWSNPAVGAKILDDFRSGRINENQAMFQVFRQRAVDANQERALRAHELNKAGREENEWDASQKADQVAHGVEENWKQHNEVFAGAGTPEELEQKAIKLAQNPNDPEAQQILQQLALSIPMYRKQLAKSLQPFTQSLGGPAKVQALVDTYAKPKEDMLALLSDPSKVGSVLFAQKHMADAMQRRQEGLISQDELGQQLMGIKAVQQMSPDLGAKMMQDLLATRPDYSDRANKLMQSFKYSALGASPESRNAPAVANAIEKTYGLNPNPKVADDYINFLSSIKDIKDPTTARNVAYAYYNPKNQGLIGQWSSNTMDPRTGKTESGQINILKKMADKSVLDKIKSIGDPKLNDHVKNFLENSFSYTVFPTLMKDVEGMSKAAGDRLGYDDEHQRFYLSGKQSQSSSYIKNAINRLNFAIESMGNLADFSGIKDKNGHIISLIMAGNPQAFSREVPGFPGEINKAIQQQALSRAMEAQKKEQDKKALQEP